MRRRRRQHSRPTAQDDAQANYSLPVAQLGREVEFRSPKKVVGFGQ